MTERTEAASDCVVNKKKKIPGSLTFHAALNASAESNNLPADKDEGRVTARTGQSSKQRT